MSTDYNIVLRAPAAEYTVSAAYSSSAPGGSTQRAVLALDYCHDLHSTMFSVDRLTKNPAFLVVTVSGKILRFAQDDTVMVFGAMGL